MNLPSVRVLGFIVLLGVAVAPLRAQVGVPPKIDELPAKTKKKTERKKEDAVRIVGSLTTKDEIDKAGGGKYFKVHVIKMTSGKSFLIDMVDPGPTGLDPYLRIEDSSGKLLAHDDDGGVMQNARIVFTPVKDDDYRVIATTFAASRTGSYLLTVQPIPLGAVIAAPGGTTQFMIPVDVGDLTITPMTAWGLNSNNVSNNNETHGYIEHRFVIENNSETTAHRVRIVLPRHRSGMVGMGHFLNSLSKTVEVGPEASVVVSLFQPDLPLMYGAEVAVEIDGQQQQTAIPLTMVNNRGGRTNIYMYSGGRAGGAQPTVLVPLGDLQAKLQANVHKSAVGVAVKPPTGGSYSTNSGNYMELGPYYNKPYTYHSIHRFQTAPAGLSDWSKHWLGYSSFEGVALPGAVWNAAAPEVQAALVQFVECGGTLLVVGTAKLPEAWARFKDAKVDSDVLERYYPGFGECLVSPKVDVNRWTPEDWRLVTGMWEQSTAAWSQIRSPTEAHQELPIVDGANIPVRGMFISMLLFVLIIGPVNVYWLSRSRRRIWLLWTVPLFSFFTCCVLIVYMLATEGWYGFERADTITVLDENAQRAATIGWVGYYCPATPSGGLHFSLATELTPHLSNRAGFGPIRRQPYTIDWTNDQHLADGWLTTKVPMHFMVRRHEKRLERVTLRKDNEGGFAVVNGLGVDIKTIHLAGLDGRIHTANEVPAGAEMKLQPTQEMAAHKSNKLVDVFSGAWVRGSEAMTKTPAEYLRPGCYQAVLDESPFLEQGLQHTQGRRLRSVVYGVLKDPL